MIPAFSFERSKTYDELKKTISDTSVSDEIRAEANKKLNEIMTFEEKEVTAQNLLSAKGFNQTVVYITDENVTVTVKRDALSKSDTAKIVDIIYEVTQNNNIKIVEVN